ncbi:Rho termination factor N-terminal domain-containing protein, partial [Clavibacter michiganensis]|uniref:Rho termination factor N-terminal domain-containing protein n=1 Tax=Clavibacter michiganensis TaxID=28447 RepID=UPI0029311E23
MTDVDTRATTADLSALRVSQLQAIASELGIPGGSKLRKGELVTAISEIQAAGGTTAPADETAPERAAPAPPGSGRDSPDPGLCLERLARSGRAPERDPLAGPDPQV